MHVAPISPVFMGNRNDNEEKNTGGVGKAAASAILPGLGQAMDGKYERGAILFGLTALVHALEAGFDRDFYKSLFKVKDWGKNTRELFKSGSKLKIFDRVTSVAILLILHTLAAYDAYKGGGKSRD